MKEELKIYLYRLWPLLVFLVGLPLLGFAVWALTPATKLAIVLLDKTVKDDDYQEHAGFFWTLEHLRYAKSNGEAYRVDRDYLGFFPDGSSGLGEERDLQNRSEAEVEKLVSETDLIYVADTYGVYKSDFTASEEEELSEKIYGGMNESELLLLKKAKEQGKVVVAEFNSIASPTPKEIRSEFENLMGLKWTGWIGRHFDELDTLSNREIPKWMISQYRRQHQTWDLKGPGLLFVHESGQIEGFLHGIDYENQVPLIRTQRMNKAGYDLPQVIPYPDWFDVMMIDRSYEVISYYDINPTKTGIQRLRVMGLPRFFPAAVVRKVDQATQYYFSGDFSDMRARLGSAHFWGLPVLWRGRYVASDYTDRESFFWNYYYPLISQVLEKSRKP